MMLKVRRFVKNNFGKYNEESLEPDIKGNIKNFSNNSNGIIRNGFLFEGHRSNSLSGTANEKGAGLGQVLWRDFAQRNSGSVRVSEAGNGSTFFVALPSSPDQLRTKNKYRIRANH